MKTLKALLPLILLFTSSIAFTQVYVMDGTPITTCSGTIFDSGGSDNDYGPNENIITTICPDFSSGTHIQISFNPTSISPSDDLCFYDGTDTNADLLVCASGFFGGAFIVQATAANVSGCLTLEFVSDGDTQNAGFAGIIECTPACQPIIAVLDNTDPAVFPVDTGYIDICKGNSVTFNGSGLYPQDGVVYSQSDLTSSFEWNFGDGSTALGPNVVHTYNEGGGYVVQLTITDNFGCKNVNFLNQRVRVSTDPNIEFGNFEDQICVNDTIELNSTVNNSNSSSTISVNPVDLGFQTGAVLSDSLALPDGNGTSYSTSVSFNNFGPGQVLTDINDLLSISVNMEHSYMGDLEITLTAPNGAEVILHAYAGLGYGNYLGEPIDDDAGPNFGLGYDYSWSTNGTLTWTEYIDINAVGTLPSGDYASFEPLTNLLGTPLNGVWTITVTDNLEIDNGFIFNWGINFDQDLFPLVETFTPALVNYTWLDQPSINFNNQDSISAIPTDAGLGNFIFEVEDEFGCLWESNVNIEILPNSHPDCFNCEDIINEFPDTTICLGDTLLIDAGGTNLNFDVPFISNTDYELGNANHPPSDPYNAEIDINSINNAVITDPLNDIVSVCLDFETNFLSDIGVYLQSPDGTIIELTTNNGGTSDFYTNTCFTPSATTNITAGTSPFTGNFQIEGNWNDLIGSPVNGTWTLLVSDDSGLTSFGNLNWWSISFASGITTDITWTPDTNIDCSDCPEVQYIPSDDTDQLLIVEAVNSLGCLDSDTIQLTIEQPIEAPMVSCNNDVAGTIVFSWPQVGTYTDYLININNAGFVSANGVLSHSVTGLNNGDLINAVVMVEATGEECTILETTIDCYNCIMTTSVQSTLPTSCFDSCDGQAVLEVTGGDLPYSFSYLDASGNTVITSSPNLSDLCAGPNVLSIIDGANCIESYNVDIAAPDSINITSSTVNDISCFGLTDGNLTITVEGGVGTVDQSLLDQSGNTADPNNLAAGQYTMILTDDNNCSSSTDFDIQEPALLEVMLENSTPALCADSDNGQATINVTGGTYPYTYSWSNSTVTDSINVSLSAGTSTVLVEDGQGCTESFDVTITAPATLDLTIIQDVEACDGLDDNVAIPTITGGTGPYTYLWSDNSTDSIATSLPVGMQSLTVTDQNGCIATADIMITDLEPITFNIIPSNPDCAGGTNGSIEVVNVNGGNEALGYNYIFNSNSPTPDSVLMNIAPNTMISIQVVDGQGCLSAMEELQLIDPPALQVNMNTQAVSCGGLTDGAANVISVSFGQAPFTYNWSAPGTGNAISNLPAGNYQITVTDDLGCEVIQDFEIQTPDPVVADFDLTQPPCNGKNTGQIDLTTTGGAGNYSYVWSSGDTSQDLENIYSGTYQVTVTDGNDCIFEFEIDLPQPTPINPGLTYEDLSCFGINDGMINFDASGATPPYLFSINGDDYLGNPMLQGLAPGEYDIQVIDDNDCTMDTTITILEPDELMINFPSGSSLSINLEDDIYLNENYIEIINNQGNYDVTWMPSYEGTLSCTDCENPVAMPFNTITYNVMVVDENNCDDVETLVINVNKYRVVLVPRGFSPNGDDNNDMLLVHGKQGTTVNTFQVFDRWGTKVFEKNDFEINEETGWDGTFQGKEMPAGAYLWYADVTYIDGLTERHEGFVNLIR